LEAFLEEKTRPQDFDKTALEKKKETKFEL